MRKLMKLLLLILFIFSCNQKEKKQSSESSGKNQIINDAPKNKKTSEDSQIKIVKKAQIAFDTIPPKINNRQLNIYI